MIKKKKKICPGGHKRECENQAAGQTQLNQRAPPIDVKVIFKQSAIRRIWWGVQAALTCLGPYFFISKMREFCGFLLFENQYPLSYKILKTYFYYKK